MDVPQQEKRREVQRRGRREKRNEETRGQEEESKGEQWEATLGMYRYKKSSRWQDDGRERTIEQKRWRS